MAASKEAARRDLKFKMIVKVEDLQVWRLARRLPGWTSSLR